MVVGGGGKVFLFPRVLNRTFFQAECVGAQEWCVELLLRFVLVLDIGLY